MLKLGTATLRKLIDLDPFVLPLDFLLPGAEIARLEHERALLAPDHIDFAGSNVLLGVHSFLLQAGELNMLIDTCVGEHKERPRRPEWHRRKAGGYLAALAGAGLRPEDIDLVFCTHLHADHVGWNTCLEGGRWVPTFPNARYVIGRKELSHWQAEEAAAPGSHNHGAYADSVLPIVESGLCETVEDGFELASGMEVVPLFGHSPGQIGLDMDCRDGTHALICGDAFHSPAQVFRPGWSSRFCHDGDAATRLRLELLERSAEDGALLLPAHIRNVHGMRILRHGAGFRPELI
jgi:glyoxylase-like metal-dependent hydrolase (beta-lactamase superfamily II)